MAWLRRCERRIWLDLHGDPAQRVVDSAFAAQRLALGHAHEQAVIDALVGTRQQMLAADWPSLLAETEAALRAGVPVIEQGGLACSIDGLNLRGRPDLLYRIAQPSALGAWAYLPIEIKLHRDPRPEDHLQLGFYRWMLSTLQGYLPEGELWLGFDAPTQQPKVRLRQSEPLELQPWLERLTLLRAGAEPPLNFSRHCSYCPWRVSCEQTALQRDELACLAHVDQRTAAALRSDGIGTLQALVQLTPEELACYPHCGPIRAQQLLGHAHALLSGMPYVHAKSAPNLPVPALFFDIESHPTTQEPWAFGWIRPCGQSGCLVVVPQRPAQAPSSMQIDGAVVSFVPDAASGWHMLAALVEDRAGALVHWGNYERQVVQRWATERVARSLTPRMCDLQRSVTRYCSFPIPRGAGHGATTLKAIGGYLGYPWPAAADWAAAWQAYQQWRHASDALVAHGACWSDTIDAGLTEGLRYLMSDVVALRGVWDWVVDRLKKDNHP